MTSFLANENFPGDAVQALRAAGHDVIWVREAMPGALDPQVIAKATDEGRVLLTFDKDFGEIAFRARLPASCGIVLFRISMPRSEDASRRLASIVLSMDDWKGHFSVVEPGRIRLRDLPT
jgi:predicted nuclease of predicted toxin-antitoxin system